MVIASVLSILVTLVNSIQKCVNKHIPMLNVSYTKIAEQFNLDAPLLRCIIPFHNTNNPNLMLNLLYKNANSKTKNYILNSMLKQ